jgi:isopenicillin N synthase-like dioxygenase
MTSAESTVTDDDFTSIPILNYALLSSPDTRPVFIRQLQHALINVGFLYLENTPDPDDALFDEVIAYLPRIFALPQERKDALRMVNSPHFLGYSRLGVERTRGAADQREQFDFATPFENGECWVPGFGQPEYVRLWGPSQVGVVVVVLVFGLVFASLEMKWSSLFLFLALVPGRAYACRCRYCM